MKRNCLLIAIETKATAAAIATKKSIQAQI